MDNSIFVKVGRFPGEVKEYGLEENSTVSTALEIAQLSLDSGSAVQVNGEPANLSTVLYDGDMVRVTKQIKGN